jgi:hypothetical protein
MHKMDDQEFESPKQFKYLVSAMREDNNITKEIINRIVITKCGS